MKNLVVIVLLGLVLLASSAVFIVKESQVGVLFQLGRIGFLGGMNAQALAFEARNHVHMDVEHRLPGR